jgi:hypothetical protein
MLVECPVRPTGAVIVEVLAQDQPQVPFAGDQHQVQALVAGAVARSRKADLVACLDAEDDARSRPRGDQLSAHREVPMSLDTGAGTGISAQRRQARTQGVVDGVRAGLVRPPTAVAQ